MLEKPNVKIKWTTYDNWWCPQSRFGLEARSSSRGRKLTVSEGDILVTIWRILCFGKIDRGLLVYGRRGRKSLFKSRDLEGEGNGRWSIAVTIKKHLTTTGGHLEGRRERQWSEEERRVGWEVELIERREEAFLKEMEGEASWSLQKYTL